MNVKIIIQLYSLAMMKKEKKGLPLKEQPILSGKKMSMAVISITVLDLLIVVVMLSMSNWFHVISDT